MSIKIVGSSNANAVFFEGATQPVYFNAVLTAQVNQDDNTRIDILNTVRTAAAGEPVYEFFGLPFNEILDADGNGFADAATAADYVTEQCNQIIGSGTKSVGPTNTIDFQTDETNTTVLVDDGSAYAVNSIRAAEGIDGLIEIYEYTPDGALIYNEIYPEKATIAGSPVSTTLASAVNELNALFSVTALGGGTGTNPAIFPTLPGSDITPIQFGGIDPIGPNIFKGTSTSQHGARMRSVETINEPGEFFTFKMAYRGQFIFGLGSVANGHETAFDGSSGNGHTGVWYSQAMYNYGSYQAPWTTYGQYSGLSYGPGWSFYGNEPMFRYSQAQDDLSDGTGALFKIEIMPTGFVGAYYFDIGETEDWILLSRSSTPLPDGEYFFTLKLSSTTAELMELPKRYAIDPVAPALNYRYIESPDGVYSWPLFATQAEADWVDAELGGAGSSQQVNFPDEPTQAIWHTLASGTAGLYLNESLDATAISDMLADPKYSVIATNADELYAPPAFVDQTVNVNEGAPVVLTVAAANASYAYSVSNLPAGLQLINNKIEGNAPAVNGDNVANPSDTYVIDVLRTNEYGSTTGQLTLNVANLTAPFTPLAGITPVAGTAAMVDADTLADGSAVDLDDTVESGKRFIMPKEWVEDYILPAVNSNGNVWLGVKAAGFSGASIEDADFDIFFNWYADPIVGGYYSHITSGGSSNSVWTSVATSGFYDIGIEVDGTDVHFIACNVNALNNEPAVNNGGMFSRVLTVSSYGGTIPLTLTFAVEGTTMDIDLTDLVEIDIPAAAPSTTYDKAVAFGGVAGYLKQQTVADYANPMYRINGGGDTVVAPGETAASGRGWCYAGVVKRDSVNTNDYLFSQSVSGDGLGLAFLNNGAGGYLQFFDGKSGGYSIWKSTQSFNTTDWVGIYMEYNGGRVGNTVSSANIESRYRFKQINLQTGAVTDIPGSWTHVGGGSSTTRTGATYLGVFEDSNGPSNWFHGQMASAVITTLRSGQLLPNDTEIEKIVADPVGWAYTYKEGQPYRVPNDTGDNLSNWSIGDADSGKATKILLMGDFMTDAYPNIKNYVFNLYSNSNYSMTNMTSADIQNININGLS
jgi:hypothetical protein